MASREVETVLVQRAERECVRSLLPGRVSLVLNSMGSPVSPRIEPNEAHLCRSSEAPFSIRIIRGAA